MPRDLSTLGVSTLLLLSIAFPVNARVGADTLTERDVVQRIERSRAPVTKANARAGKAGINAASVWPNPSLSVSREQILGEGQASDSYVTLTVPLAFGGQRQIRRLAARHDAIVGRRRGRQATASAQLVGRRLFVDLCINRSKVRVLEGVIARMTKLVAASEARLERGDASRYNTSRLQLELLARRGQVATLEAGRRVIEGRLAGLMGLPHTPSLTLRASCLQAPPLPPLSNLIAAMRHNPALHTLLARSRRAGRLASATLGDRLPQLSIVAGYRGSRVAGVAGNGDGFVVGLSLPLPFVDRGQGRRGKAAATQQLLSAQIAMLRRRLMAQIRATHGALRRTSAREALARRQLAAAKTVLRAAEALLRAGEGQAYRVIDAYRGLWEGQLATIDAKGMFRRLWIDLARATGNPTLGVVP